MSFLQAENLHDDLKAPHHLLRMLPAQPVIRRDVRLALARVDDGSVHLADAAGELDVGGEGRAAHTDDAGLVNDIHQLLRRQRIHFLLGAGLNRLAQSIQMVIFDHNAQHRAAVGVGPHLHRFHLAGNGSVDRNAQALIVADLLALGHQITLGDQRLTGRADMLRHRDHNDVRLRKYLGFLVARIPFVFFGMHPAEKGKRHVSSPLSNFAERAASIRIHHSALFSICPHFYS